MNKPLVKIENWSVVDDLIFHGYRELEPGQRLTGDIPGNANLPKGVIYTSVIEGVDGTKGLVETFNSVYELGRPNEEYERWLLEQEEARAGLVWDDVHSCFVNTSARKQPVAHVVPSPGFSWQPHQR